MRFSFSERQPTRWLGRYRRIEGRESVFHVRWDDTVDILWRDSRDEAHCPAVMSGELKKLANCTNAVKRMHTGQPGGAFLINEFGQVISPVAAPPWHYFYVGDCTGVPAFRYPDGGRFTLNDDDGLEIGDQWDPPYVGIAHNLSARNRIYFQKRHGRETEIIYLPQNDPQLIRALREVRPNGAVRFIVNPHGIVLTKVPPDWRPVYVGRIDYDRWFPRDEG